jgi:hypothetical protein
MADPPTFQKIFPKKKLVQPFIPGARFPTGGERVFFGYGHGLICAALDEKSHGNFPEETTIS